MRYNNIVASFNGPYEYSTRSEESVLDIASIRNGSSPRIDGCYIALMELSEDRGVMYDIYVPETHELFNIGLIHYIFAEYTHDKKYRDPEEFNRIIYHKLSK